MTAPSFTIALNPTVAAGDTVQLLLGGSALAHPVTHTITAADIAAGSVSLTVTAGDLGADGTKSITAQFSDVGRQYLDHRGRLTHARYHGAGGGDRQQRRSDQPGGADHQRHGRCRPTPAPR